MNLDEYMKSKELTDEAFGKLIKKSRMQVLRYRHGEQIPGRDAMKRIFKVTEQQVPPDSFYFQAVKA